MYFRVLGPLSIGRDGSAQAAINAPLVRRLLAALLCRANEFVSVDDLVLALWGDKSPPSARKTLQVYVRRLRQALDDDLRIAHEAAGYRVTVADDELDVLNFTRMVAQASEVDIEQASNLLASALSLWRGQAYEDMRQVVPIANEARHLDEERLRVQTWYARLQLELGRHAELVPYLAKLVDEHPYREDLRGHLMLALYRCGRQADALEVYRATRKVLAEELGVEPAPALQRLHETMLRADASLELARVPASTVPRQLPLDFAAFAGRANQLRLLDETLPSLAPVVITAIAGSAGVGKSALAIHWAHSVAHKFPDGQLYINLRGFDAEAAVSPADAIRRFLDSLGTAPQHIPMDLDAQATLYRSLLADKRILLVLDNAQSAEQVRPLLPGGSRCRVLVTSRNRLAGLAATSGARPVFLDVLTFDEAQELLAARIGEDRMHAEPEAVEEIVARCASLPLALAVAAARAALHPEMPLAVLAAELRDAHGALDAFASTNDPITDLRSVFSWSIVQLSPQAARLFRLVGMHPGPDTNIAAAASLVGLSLECTRPLLGELVHAHLLWEHVPGRYAFHDLLRAYANELGSSLGAEVDAALLRLFDHYLHVAHRANRLIEPQRKGIPTGVTAAGVTLEDLTGPDRAMMWMAAEHQVLLAVIKQAAKAGLATHVWKLAWSLSTFLDWRGHWRDLAHIYEIALDAVQGSTDQEGLAHAHHGLARAHASLGDYGKAEFHLRRTIDLRGEAGDLVGQANAYMALSLVNERQVNYAQALEHSLSARGLFDSAGHRAGQAASLNAIGWLNALLGEHRDALAYGECALPVFEELGDRQGLADVWHTIATARHGLGQPEAIDCFQKSVNLYREIGNRYHEALGLQRLGDAYLEAGDLGSARDAWRRALEILTEVGHPSAGEVRSKLGG